MLLVLPENERTFLEEMENYSAPKARSIALKNVMGYDRHRIVKEGVCVSDMAEAGLSYLFSENLLKKEDIDALLIVTQTPDYFIPPTSCVLHGKLQLKQDAFCLDINQGCAGFLVGLMQAFSLLEQEHIRKVVLINADVLSRKVSPGDRNSYPLVGDAAAITIVERSNTKDPIYGLIKTDGSRSSALIIPAGGMRRPFSAETAKLVDAGDGNRRAEEHLKMEGGDVFNFVMSDVPPLIKDLFEETGQVLSETDYFLCHQPNRFMLQKLAERLQIPPEKMPSNVVEHFGNSSGASIPACIVLNLSETVTSRGLNVCFSGFGVGLTWAAMTMKLGPMQFCRRIDFK